MPLLRVVAVQTLLTAFLSVTLWFFDWVAAYSALLGGLACVLPGLYLFATSLQPPSAGSGLGKALKGEAGRLAITIAIFLGVFALVRPLDVLAFFGAFAVLQLAYWVALVAWRP